MEDFAVRREAALEGFGFTLLPEEYCAADLSAGDLVQLLPDWSLPGARSSWLTRTGAAFCRRYALGSII